MGIVTEVSYENDCIKVGDGDQGFKVWQPSTEYGWTATSSIKNSSGRYVKYDSEGTLALPEIDLGGYSSASLSFTHVLNFCTSPDKYLSVEAHCDVSLNQFVGKKIQIVFRYTGTTSVSATWEIQKTTVTGKKASSSIVAVSSSSQFDSTKPYEVFDMSGHWLSQNEYKHGVVIIRQGGKVFKMVKK